MNRTITPAMMKHIVFPLLAAALLAASSLAAAADLSGRYVDPDKKDHWFELRTDGTWTLHEGNRDMTGTSVVEGDSLKLSTPSEKESINIKITAEGLIGPKGGKPWTKAAAASTTAMKSPGADKLAGTYTLPKDGEGAALELKADGTFAVTRKGENVASGTYTAQGDTLTFTSTKEKQPLILKVDADGGLIGPDGKKAIKVPATPTPTPVPAALVGRYPKPDQPDNILELKADSTWTTSRGGEVKESGTFTIKDDTLILTPVGRPGTLTLKFNAEGVFPPGADKPVQRMK